MFYKSALQKHCLHLASMFTMAINTALEWSWGVIAVRESHQEETDHFDLIIFISSQLGISNATYMCYWYQLYNYYPLLWEKTISMA